MPKLGSVKHPAVVRVQTKARAAEITDIFNEHGWYYIVGIEPDKPEDISDLTRLLNPPAPAIAGPTLGRNEPCPCGSGKKYKKCCGR